MVCKLIFGAVALLCVAQVLAGPVLHHQHTEVKVAGGRTLFDDILAAVAAVEILVEDALALEAKVVNIRTAVLFDVMKELNYIITRLISLKVPQADIDALKVLIDVAITDANKTILAELSNLAHILQLLAKISDHLFFHHDRLPTDLAFLQTAIKKLETDFLAGVSTVATDASNIQKEILVIIEGLSGAAANEIRVALERLEKDLIAEYESIVTSFNTTIGAAANCIVAIKKVIAHFGL